MWLSFVSAKLGEGVVLPSLHHIQLVNPVLKVKKVSNHAINCTSIMYESRPSYTKQNISTWLTPSSYAFQGFVDFSSNVAV